MKKNLPLKIVLLFALSTLFVLVSHAENRLRNSDDQTKIDRMKEYLQQHPVRQGQTNFVAEQLRRAENGHFENGRSYVSGQHARIISSNHVSSPLNDDCANATLLTEDAVCNSTSGDVAGATQVDLPEACGIFTSDSSFDVWYQFVAVTTNPYISVTGSASFDPVIFLYDGCGGSILDCSDATYSGGTELIIGSGLSIGTTYYVRVYDYGNALPATTTFDICVYSAPPAPANDECADAILITETAGCNPTGGTVAASTESMPADACNAFTSTSAYDVWYQFVATSSSPFIQVTGDAGFDAVVFLYDACGGSIIDCADNTTAGASEVIVGSGLSIGTTYFIRVYSYGSAIPATPGFNICVFDDSPYPANDTLCSAVTLTLDGPVESGDNSLAALTDPLDGDVVTAGYACSSPNNTMWYTYLAASAVDSFYINYSAFGSFDGWLGIFTSDDVGNPCAGTLTYVDCPTDAYLGAPQVYAILPPSAGTMYVLMVDGVSGSVGPFSLQITSSNPTGVQQVISRASDILIYPNPSAGILNVDLGTSFSGKSTVKMYDLPGNLLKEETIQNTHSKKLDVSGFANGIYFVKVENENGSVIRKISLNK